MNIEEVLDRKFWKVINYIGNKGVDIDEYILKKFDAPLLDPVKKKKLKYPSALFPLENAPVEWWYFTGHLEEVGGKEKKGKMKKDGGKGKFGFEFCIFKIHPEIIRIGVVPLYAIRKQPYLVLHNAVTDKSNGKFRVIQESGMIEKDLIEYGKLHLALGDSYLDFNKKFRIRGKMVDLELKPRKKFIRHFDKGFVINHSRPEARAYYLSFTRLETSGKIMIDGKEYRVSGESWFDHQKCNKITKSSWMGWDWFSVILEDGTELMIYTIRDKRGMNYRHLGASYVDKNSRVVNLKPREVKIKVLDKWKSKKTGAEYPSGWEIEIDKLKTKLRVTPCLKDQEIDALLSSGVVYWEGACDVEGVKKGNLVKGNGYVELVGYDRAIVPRLVRQLIIQ